MPADTKRITKERREDLWFMVNNLLHGVGANHEVRGDVQAIFNAAQSTDKRVEALLNFMKAKLHHFPVDDQYVATQLLEMFEALPSQENP